MSLEVQESEHLEQCKEGMTEHFGGHLEDKNDPGDADKKDYA